jgi:hypothetical protein
VRKVLAMNATAVPRIEREERAAPHRQRILELLPQCKGNLVRVHEELTAEGVTMTDGRNRVCAPRAGPIPRDAGNLWRDSEAGLNLCRAVIRAWCAGSRG